MASKKTLKLQQSPLGAVLPECWKLVPDRALTLHPHGAGVLRVSHGRVWATLNGPHQGPANDWGDRVLRSGEQLLLLPGQNVVMEVYGEAVNQAAYFTWEPSHSVKAPAMLAATPWSDPLARPVLRADPNLPRLLPVFAAIGRRLVTLGRVLQWLVPGRGRPLSAMECNQP